MSTLNKRNLYIVICFVILSSLAYTVAAYAENLEEIIDSQKEIKRASDEKNRKLKAQEKLLAETKDAISMGHKEYERTCSLCHGIDAKGHGVYAFELNNAPANLTQIKNKNGGIFPFIELYRIIDGRKDIKSHGTRIMPVWGDRFNSESWLDTNQRNSETLVRGRIFELLLYLETIQN